MSDFSKYEIDSFKKLLSKLGFLLVTAQLLIKLKEKNATYIYIQINYRYNIELEYKIWKKKCLKNVKENYELKTYRRRLKIISQKRQLNRINLP